ncbi:MAG TPA: UDP-N-acetylmuramate dehydrogenase [Chitinophagaceae bacterium]|jgi:UDP-N-acetylmuramate dehydrogenase|nr:UDP-N-acetylmuramate dehydrogenase [Chitinophagaceae bacterium]
MNIQENISLKPFNTFHIDAKAQYYAPFTSVNELSELISRYPKQPLLILGGGSNILLTKDVPGLVLKNEIRGIDKIKEDEQYIYVRAGAGENWHQFVLQCIQNKWAGVENLSLIPGNVGASPMQNIGAYGVEIKDVFHELKAWHLQEKCNYTFSLKDCEFGYRESVFKRKYKGQFVITSVCFKLRKQPVFNTSYGAIEQELAAMDVKELSIKAVSDAVIRIRSSKLPDPAEIGNAGSFFKNPAITRDKYESLKQRFPAIVGYDNPDGSVKLAAGWLIEQCAPPVAGSVSWKGFREGDAGCHAKQALVLVNYGNATGEQVYDLSTRIVESVQEKFGVELEREVNII